MKKVLAVSGGIDSVCLLHLYRNDPDVVVAHFDHGIRENSADDCAFVARLASEYGLKFVSKRLELGKDCSEELARKSRYDFFESLLEKPEDRIYTAHHSDDMLESAVINLVHGTGWRGIAPLRSEKLERPLLSWTKKDIYRYATENKLSFRLDQTNNEDKYLRNRIRKALSEQGEEKKEKLKEIILRQRQIADEVDGLLSDLVKLDNRYSRAMFDDLDDFVALEILRYLLSDFVSLTRPQLMRTLEAIRSFAPGKRFSLTKAKFLRIERYYFSFETEA